MPTKVRLIRKFAHVIDGIDLSRVRSGDEIELTARDAEILIAEGWAMPTGPATASDQPRRLKRERPQIDKLKPARNR